MGSDVPTSGLGWLIGLFFLAVRLRFILAFFILAFFDLVFFDLRFLAMRLPLCIYSSHRRLHDSDYTVSAEYEGGWRIDWPAAGVTPQHGHDILREQEWSNSGSTVEITEGMRDG